MSCRAFAKEQSNLYFSLLYQNTFKEHSHKMAERKKIAVVGTGGRVVMFLDAIAGTYKDSAQLVGLCDLSPTRMAFHNERLRELYKYPALPTYKADQFDKMIAEQKPDEVVVTTSDDMHHKYVIRALELGCDAIVEKPLTNDADKARAIFAAVEKTGHKVRVTFNYRYAPVTTVMRDAVMKGLVGTPLFADMQYILNTSHGADYFRRWHSERAVSNGLLLHKSTHHFDLLNWWVDSYPKRLFAVGELKFYGEKAAKARGESYSYERYTGHPEAAKDPFALFLNEDKQMKALYMDAEKDTGYIRDRNVFGKHVDIEDTVAIAGQFRNGVILSYSLITYSPWEGFRASITGTKGRVEVYVKHETHIIRAQSDKELAAEQAGGEERVTYFPMFGQPQDIPIPHAEGGHGGGDPLLLEQLFSPNPPVDPYKRNANHLDGAGSILWGAAAVRSIQTGQPVNVDDLLKLPVDGPSQAYERMQSEKERSKVTV
jgi:predicted dehydrogenase